MAASDQPRNDQDQELQGSASQDEREARASQGQGIEEADLVAPEESLETAEPATGTSLQSVEGQVEAAESAKEAAEGEEKTPQLEFEFDVEVAGPCKRRVIITIPRKEVDRYFAEELDKVRPEASVPGFRPGRVPRRLLEKYLRRELSEPVKNRLILDSITQLTELAKLAPISDPDLDTDEIELLDEGDFAFEFSIEVRPEFEMPQWRGLKLRKKVFSYTPQYLQAYLETQARTVAKPQEIDGPAQLGDYIECDISIWHEGQLLNSAEGERLMLRPRLTFLDGVINDFGDRMQGVMAGESRTCDLQVSENCANPDIAGKVVQAKFKVHKIRRMQMAGDLENIAQLLGYSSEEEFRREAEERLRLRLELDSYMDLRKQILDQLLDVVPFDLPQDLITQQTERELRRRAVDMLRSGISREEIQADLNSIARDARNQIVRLLREHFLLERLAEEEAIEATDQDIEEEIKLMAARMGRSPRQVRAEFEQEGAMDVVRNACVERKVISRIIEAAEVTEEPVTLFGPEEQPETAVDFAVARTTPGTKSPES